MAISGWGVFLIVLVLVVIGGGGGYVFYTHYRAKKLGLPPPNLNPFQGHRGDSSLGGPVAAAADLKGWITNKWQSLRNSRTAGGAYEGSALGGPRDYNQSNRGFGALDPDEAWNARVDDEAGGYYEEQELGLQDPSRGPYGGGGYGGDGGPGGLAADRGRSRSRDGRPNPFGDQAEPSDMSLRSISPRPDTEQVQAQRPGHQRGPSNLSVGDSPTERKSMFKEDV